MTQAKKFLFDRCFDLADPVEMDRCSVARSADEPVHQPAADSRFTEDDLARARAEAMAEGRSLAIAEAADALERRLACALESIDRQLGNALSRYREAGDQTAREAITVAVAIARKMLPELYRRNAPLEIEAAVATIMAGMLGQPPLTVRVSPALCDSLSERLGELARVQGYAGQIRVVADPRIADGDCHIEWAEGGAERHAEKFWNEIDEIIQRTIGATSTSRGETTIGADNLGADGSSINATRGGAEFASAPEVGVSHG